MPNWQPNWQNVLWDWGAADAAIRALHQSADKLDSSARDRQRAATEAQREWRGRYKDEFDHHLERMLRQAGELAHECRQAASRIASASDRAYWEQRHREADRRRWWEEKRREDEERRRRRRN